MPEFITNLSPEQWLFGLFGAIVLVFLIIDLVILQKNPHKVSFKSALWQTLFWFGLAMTFAVLIYFFHDKELAFQFVSAYLMEESLSVDNMFVFILILTYFKVPEQYYHRVLFFGVFGAIVFRGIFIVAGSLLIKEFHWILYLFGALLILTGLKMLFTNKAAEFNPDKNWVYKFLTKHLRFTKQETEGKFYIFDQGKIYFTQLFLVVALIETTDILFAIDSIPAVFAISQNQFVIYTSNIFAVMGLRALFFLLSGMLDRFHFLQQGISFILMFIGVKMMMEIVDYKMPTQYSLAVIVMMLASSIVLSLVLPDKRKK